MPDSAANAAPPRTKANAAPPRTKADTVQIRSLPNSAELSPALSHPRGTRKIPADENSDDRNEQAAREGSLFFLSARTLFFLPHLSTSHAPPVPHTTKSHTTKSHTTKPHTTKPHTTKPPAGIPRRRFILSRLSFFRCSGTGLPCPSIGLK